MQVTLTARGQEVDQNKSTARSLDIQSPRSYGYVLTNYMLFTRLAEMEQHEHPIHH